MVCLGYFLTVSCEKNVDFLKKIINILKKYIFDWPESGIRILLHNPRARVLQLSPHAALRISPAKP